MFFTVLILIAVILAASFGLHIKSLDPIRILPDSVAGGALWVCPKASGIFDQISRGLIMFRTQILIGFFFCLMLLLTTGGWALYQNLLKDEFDNKKYLNVWKFTKLFFWVVVITMILMYTPNHWKSVNLRGTTGDYILCENNQPGARPVRADAVIPGR